MATNGTAATAAASPPSEPVPTITKPEPSKAAVELDGPLTSAQDDGQSKRPRDARLIHVVLSSLGIHSYQERVPLQLLDFAYRYTSGVLSDSLRLSEEGYINADRGTKRTAAAAADTDKITVTALRQAIASRQGHTFQGALPKEFMMELASERNRVALPKVERSYGMQLPPEKYCLTGVGWGLNEEWDSEEEILGAEAGDDAAGEDQDDEKMGGIDDADEEGAGRMEDVFGHDATAKDEMDQD